MESERRQVKEFYKIMNRIEKQNQGMICHMSLLLEHYQNNEVRLILQE